LRRFAVQDAINKLANDMVIASEFQAFRQRVLTGVEIPKNPETGEPLESQQLEAAMSRLWTFENPDAKVHDLEAASLANYTDALSHTRPARSGGLLAQRPWRASATTRCGTASPRSRGRLAATRPRTTIDHTRPVFAASGLPRLGWRRR
jgi:hypothetical protein